MKNKTKSHYDNFSNLSAQYKFKPNIVFNEFIRRE